MSVSLSERLAPVLRVPTVTAATLLAVISVTASALATDLDMVAQRTFAQPSLRPSVAAGEIVVAAEASSTVEVQVGDKANDAGAAAVVPAQTAPTMAPSASTGGKSQLKPAGKEQPAWPKTLPEAKAEALPAKADEFTAEEIASAKAHCKALLKGLDVVVVEEQPIKSGECGTPAPVQLISLGRSPQVALSPPATMTCDMVAALHKWVTQDIQPLAKKHLGAAVIGMQTMSSYSCRNAYGRRKTNLSEHGRANAVDIRAFATADARETSVLADWGPTGREIRSQIAAAQAAAKVAAEKLASDRAAAAVKTQAASGIAPSSQAPATTAAIPSTPSPAAAPSIGTLVEGVPGIASRLPGAAPAAEGRAGYGLIRPSQLGGPKVVAEKPASNKAGGALALGPAEGVSDGTSQTRKAMFLREAHAAACRIFGTTLGPETNVAHKNHFHVDMAERNHGNYCE